MTGHLKRGRVDGTWYLRYELPRDSNGNRRQQRVTFRGTKREAEVRLRQLLLEAENGGFDSRIRMKELCKRWVATTEHRVGTKTHRRYESIVRLYLVPAFGPIRVSELRPAHIEAALASWISGKRNDKKKGQLSQRSVKHILDTLKMVCRWAVRMNVALRNPVDAVASPKVERREMRALDAEGVGKLLDAAHGTDLEAPLVVAVGTGLRRGELLALKWSDINLDAAQLAVRRSLETIDGVTRTKSPKTARSARTIALPSFVVEALRRRKAEQSERRIRYGLGREADPWVFTRADESPWEPGTFSLHFARLVKRHQLPHVRFHDLRHTFGTLALASGVDLKSVSSALGHSTISMTANIYVHAVEALQRDAAARIDAMLGGTVTEAVATAGGGDILSASVPQRCHTPLPTMKKARGYGPKLVAPTGIEPVFPP